MESRFAGFRAFYKKFEDIVSEIMIGICVAIFAVMVFSVAYGVLGRYLTFIKAARWTQELAILCMVWLCFVTAGYAIKEDKHVRMTIINRIVPEKAAKALHAFTYVLLLRVNLFFIIYGWKLSVLSAKAKMLSLNSNSSWLAENVSSPPSGTWYSPSISSSSDVTSSISTTICKSSTGLNAVAFIESTLIHWSLVISK